MCSRFVLGEGIEKKTNDLAKEVEEQTKAFEEAAAKKAAAAPKVRSRTAWQLARHRRHVGYTSLSS